MSDFRPRHYGGRLAPGQRAELRIHDLGRGRSETLFATDKLMEAPNWTVDGAALIFNAGGELWRLPLDAPVPAHIDTGPLRELNNDHVLSPDGREIFVSSDDGHLYRLPIAGGMPRRVSNDHQGPFHYYLHGISPDGTELAYVGLEGPEGADGANIFTLPASGGPDRRLTAMAQPCDGPEYTTDGGAIVFNSEFGARRPGHAQLFEMGRDGSDLRQLTDDARVNWFPHVSPDGANILYLSYPPGTLGHPADKPVEVRLIRRGGGRPEVLAAFNGGQGTINVNSWAPDGRRFAYVAYPKR